MAFPRPPLLAKASLSIGTRASSLRADRYAELEPHMSLRKRKSNDYVKLPFGMWLPSLEHCPLPVAAGVNSLRGAKI